MVLERECLRKLEGRFCLIEEKRVEKFSAHSLSNSNQKLNSLKRLYSSKYFRVFYKPSIKNGLEISISKKYFKLAVERNKIKRQIKEIFRSVIGEIPVGGVIVFSVFRPYGELSYKSASLEIASAIKKFSGELDLK
jgi:ribonuclease P protein component